MDQFRKRIAELAKPFEEASRFRRDKGGWSDLVVWVRRESEAVCSYLFVRDDRSARQGIKFDYWVAPADTPDDSIESLGIGYMIRLGEPYKFEEPLLAPCFHRVQVLASHVDSLVQAVEEELRSPPIVTRRLGVYRDEQRLWALLRSDTSPEIVQLLHELRSQAAMMVRGRKSGERFDRICMDAASKLKEMGWARKHLPPPHDRDLIALGMFRHLYLEALAPWPPAAPGS